VVFVSLCPVAQHGTGHPLVHEKIGTAPTLTTHAPPQGANREEPLLLRRDPITHSVEADGAAGARLRVSFCGRVEQMRDFLREHAVHVDDHVLVEPRDRAEVLDLAE